MPAIQKRLSTEQIEAFHHEEFAADQTRHFIELVGDDLVGDNVVIDVGGGCGFFAKRLTQSLRCRARVIDMDAASVEACRRAGIEAVYGDALDPPIDGDENVVAFNLILHHLVGASEKSTVELQRRALGAWRLHARAVFVNEYIYESYLGNLSGWLIFQITKSKTLSRVGRFVAAFVPALRANTFGVGVRFRAHEEWRRLFAAWGYAVKSTAVGKQEYISPPLRLLLIKQIRRDSFLLSPCLPTKPS
jgi:hypothetical protein